MNKSIKKGFSVRNPSGRTLILIFSFLMLTLTSIFLSYFNSGFGGAEDDSQFYLNMFDYIRNNKSSIPMHSYEVASSPIFVHVFGFGLFLFGSYGKLILPLAFLVMTAGSVIFFERLIRHANIENKIYLLTIYCGSGYLVAPMLHPTSDSPMIFFLTLSLYAFSASKRKLLSFSLFGLVSVRQSLGWLLVVFILWDIYNFLKFRKFGFSTLAWTYSWSCLSLLATFLYFDNRLFPNIYVESQPWNVFSLPNFFSVIQIGVSSLVIVTPLLLFGFKSFHFSKGSIFLIIYLASLSFATLVFSQKNQIGEGLGYLSLLYGKFDLGIAQLAAVSAFGFLLLLLLAQELSDNDKKFLYFYLLGFVTASLVMPIPFLRYFQIPLILAVAFISKNAGGNFKPSSTRIRICVVSLLVATNLGSIAL